MSPKEAILTLLELFSPTYSKADLYGVLEDCRGDLSTAIDMLATGKIHAWKTKKTYEKGHGATRGKRDDGRGRGRGRGRGGGGIGRDRDRFYEDPKHCKEQPKAHAKVEVLFGKNMIKRTEVVGRTSTVEDKKGKKSGPVIPEDIPEKIQNSESGNKVDKRVDGRISKENAEAERNLGGKTKFGKAGPVEKVLEMREVVGRARPNEKIIEVKKVVTTSPFEMQENKTCLKRDESTVQIPVILPKTPSVVHVIKLKAASHKNGNKAATKAAAARKNVVAQNVVGRTKNLQKGPEMEVTDRKDAEISTPSPVQQLDNIPEALDAALHTVLAALQGAKPRAEHHEKAKKMGYSKEYDNGRKEAIAAAVHDWNKASQEPQKKHHVSSPSIPLYYPIPVSFSRSTISKPRCSTSPSSSASPRFGAFANFNDLAELPDFLNVVKEDEVKSSFRGAFDGSFSPEKDNRMGASTCESLNDSQDFSKAPVFELGMGSRYHQDGQTTHETLAPPYNQYHHRPSTQQRQYPYFSEMVQCESYEPQYPQFNPFYKRYNGRPEFTDRPRSPTKLEEMFGFGFGLGGVGEKTRNFANPSNRFGVEDPSPADIPSSVDVPYHPDNQPWMRNQ